MPGMPSSRRSLSSRRSGPAEGIGRLPGTLSWLRAVAVNSLGGRITVTAGSGTTLHVTDTLRYEGAKPEPQHEIDGTGIATSAATARTNGGAATLTFTKPPAAVRVDSGGGDVTLRLPPDRYRVEAQGGGGTTTVQVP